MSDALTSPPGTTWDAQQVLRSRLAALLGLVPVSPTPPTVIADAAVRLARANGVAPAAILAPYAALRPVEGALAILSDAAAAIRYPCVRCGAAERAPDGNLCAPCAAVLAGSVAALPADLRPPDPPPDPADLDDESPADLPDAPASDAAAWDAADDLAQAEADAAAAGRSARAPLVAPPEADESYTDDGDDSDDADAADPEATADGQAALRGGFFFDLDRFPAPLPAVLRALPAGDRGYATLYAAVLLFKTPESNHPRYSDPAIWPALPGYARAALRATVRAACTEAGVPYRPETEESLVRKIHAAAVAWSGTIADPKQRAYAEALIVAHFTAQDLPRPVPAPAPALVSTDTRRAFAALVAEIPSGDYRAWLPGPVTKPAAQAYQPPPDPPALRPVPDETPAVAGARLRWERARADLAAAQTAGTDTPEQYRLVSAAMNAYSMERASAAGQAAGPLRKTLAPIKSSYRPTKGWPR